VFILDTNICIYIIKKQPASVLARFEQLQVGEVAMSLVTFGELEYGALRSQNQQKAKQILNDITRFIPVLSMEQSVAEHYADIRADLAAKGKPIGNNDLWIAAHARSLDAILVSNNLKEFERVDGLKLENWV
jgi:tRNA(fMet)-specific endonuclease VapC